MLGWMAPDALFVHDGQRLTPPAIICCCNNEPASHSRKGIAVRLVDASGAVVRDSKPRLIRLTLRLTRHSPEMSVSQ